MANEINGLLKQEGNIFIKMGEFDIIGTYQAKGNASLDLGKYVQK
jgi:hypothetical protein